MWRADRGGVGVLPGEAGSVTAKRRRKKVLVNSASARAYAQRGGRSVSRSVFCRGRTEEVEGSPFELSCGDDHFRICCSARFLGLFFRASRPRRAVCGVRNRELDLCLCGVSVRFYALKSPMSHGFAIVFTVAFAVLLFAFVLMFTTFAAIPYFLYLQSKIGAAKREVRTCHDRVESIAAALD